MQTVIRWCGMYPQATTGFAYHNGEGVYVGTSPKSTDLVGYAHDTTRGTVVRDSTIDTFGSECFDVKENSSHNRIESSHCAGNLEPAEDLGSNIELRGFANTVLGNDITSSTAYGLKISSDSPAYDRGANSVVGNEFAGQVADAFVIKSRVPQGQLCGNTLVQPDSGAPTATTEPC